MAGSRTLANPGHLEPLSAVLRIGGEYGEPYTWAATIRFVTPTEVEVLGANRAPTPDERRSIRQVLRAAGIEKAFYQRRTANGIRRIELVN